MATVTAQPVVVSNLSSRTALALLIAISTLVRLVWSAGMGLGNDEAYHYLFTLHPDWSYFDHPPMTMCVEWLGLALCGGWVAPLSLRLGFVLMMAGSTWLMARVTARWYGDWSGFYAALLLNLTIYYGAVGGWALPDPPLLFFALLTTWGLCRALLDQPKRTLPWAWVGLAFAGALLSKYHAVFLPMGAILYIVLTPGARSVLRRPGPYVGMAIGLLGFVPVLIWNAEHGWMSFVFQGSRAIGTTFRVSGLLATVFGPAVYLLPWTWGLLLTILFGRLRNFRTIADIDRLLVCLAVVPIVVFLVLSPMREMLPHWSLIGYVMLLPMAGARWAAWSEARPQRVRAYVAATTAFLIMVAGLAIAQCQFGVFAFPGKDPLHEASGWESLGPELQSRGLLASSKTFVFTDRWYESGQLAFALRRQPVPVLCYNKGDSRGFGQWSAPGDWVGWDGILLTTRDCPKEMHVVRMYFEKVELIDTFPMMRGNNAFRTVKVWRCTHQHRPFPFRYGDQAPDWPDDSEFCDTQPR